MTNINQARICTVAGHAWIQQSDSWGHWRLCQRCGSVASVFGTSEQRRAHWKDVRHLFYPNSRWNDIKLSPSHSTPRVSRSGVVICNAYVYQDEVGPGKPRCVLPFGHAGMCSDYPLK